MPTRSLPENPSLENLKNQARSLQQQVRAGDPEAISQVREFDPRSAVDPGKLSGFSLTEAQLVTARGYGFAGWQRLRTHVDVIREFSRWPEPVSDVTADGTDGTIDPQLLADRFLDLACLSFTRDGRSRQSRARELLSAHPELATASIHTMAVVGEVSAVRRLLASDPSQARRKGGPFDWEPLLYLANGRLGDTGPGRSAVEVTRLLLDAGADHNAGYLWRGMTSPFTALTGVFGGGEQNQPYHPDAAALARLLLSAGADPNDNQALYNRMFTPANDHLELLFEFGLGSEIDSPWRQRLGHTYPSPTQMVQEQLRWAADHGMLERVRLLLAHDVDPDGLGYHPVYGAQTPYQLALAAGNRDIARVLAEAGATTTGIHPVQEFLNACMAGDRPEAERLRAADPSLPDRAIAAEPAAVAKAVQTGHIEAVRLMLDVGFDVNAGGTTALHEAAWRVDIPIAQLLLDCGADQLRRDHRFDSTPPEWARHAASEAAYLDDQTERHQQMVEFLTTYDA
ncbi:ankyrin repeat domain-containing protein [Actinopolymorpha sp. B9G3]|uniref:ankyrin repeat domain-containing protein n=1 Tax=Actinopolymorpha sp. B9G3 TaxID=3158970 RepID=UPI0032D8FF43